jgi:hypothetical protein
LLLARLLLAATLLLAGLLARVLLTRVLGLLARFLIWIAHSGSPLLNSQGSVEHLGGDKSRGGGLVALEQQVLRGFNVAADWRRRGSGTGSKNNPVQALLLMSGTVAAPSSPC